MGSKLRIKAELFRIIFKRLHIFVDPGVYIYVYIILDYFFSTQVMLPDDLFFSYEFNLLQFVSLLVWRLLNVAMFYISV